MKFLRRNGVPQDIIPEELQSVGYLSSPTLILNRYALAEPNDRGEKDKDGKGVKEKSLALDAAIEALTKVKSVYKEGFETWMKSFESVDDAQKAELTFSFDKNQRVIVGFGGTNVIDSGITLLHPYGVPYIPGSALKGLAAHYCHKSCGAQNPDFKIGGRVHRAFFGSRDEVGAIIFHDAWIKPESVVGSLKRDVLTPHHQSYNDGGAAPTDFDTPVPVAFLSASGSFVTFLTLNEELEPEAANSVLNFAKNLLENALKEEGVGGKTNAGYGTLLSDEERRLQANRPAPGARSAAEMEATKLAVAQATAEPKQGATYELPFAEIKKTKNKKTKVDKRSLVFEAPQFGGAVKYRFEIPLIDNMPEDELKRVRDVYQKGNSYKVKVVSVQGELVVCEQADSSKVN